jgi:hypothetical protein
MNFPLRRRVLRSACLLSFVFSGLCPAFGQQLVFEGEGLTNRFYSSDTGPTNSQLVLDFPITQAGLLEEILTWGQATDADGTLSGIGQSFTAFVLRPTSSDSTSTNFQVMAASVYFTVTNVGTNIFSVSPFNVQAGDWIAHYGRGIPLSNGTGGPASVYLAVDLPVPVVGTSIQLPGSTYPLYNDGGRNYAIQAGVIPLRTLNIARQANNVVITWIGSPTDILLQSTNLLESGVWTTNSSFVSANGTNTLTLASPTSHQFFKLGNP